MAKEVEDILADAQAVSAALTNITTGIKALDDLITQLQATPGPVTQADLDNIQTAVKGLRTQAEGVNTAPPTPPPAGPVV